jgi:acyl-CoA synthetase (AMP-forming)/AMP-acid ligase II
MTTSSHAPTRSAVSEDQPETIVDALDATAAAAPDSPALQALGGDRVITWEEYARR